MMRTTTHRQPLSASLASLVLLSPACILDTKNGGALDTGADGGSTAGGSETGEPSLGGTDGSDGSDGSDGNGDGDGSTGSPLPNPGATCTNNGDCFGGELVCAFGVCTPYAAPACDAAPVCGDGIIGPFEECEGDTHCTECIVPDNIATDAKPAAIRVHAIAEISGDRYATIGWLGDTPDVAAVSLANSNLDEIATAAISDSIATPQDIATGPNDMIFAAGLSSARPGALTDLVVVALDSDLNELWTAFAGVTGDIGVGLSMAANSKVIVVGAGSPSIDDAPAVWLLNTQGQTLAFGEEVSGGSTVVLDIALVPGAATAVLMVGAPEAATPTLARWDLEGALQWSTDLSDLGDNAVPSVVLRDPDGSTWLAAHAGAGAIVAHHSAAGQELVRWDCVGGSGAAVLAMDWTSWGAIGLGLQGAQTSDGPWYAVLDPASGRIDGVFNRDVGEDSVFAAYLFSKTATPLAIYTEASATVSTWRGLWTPV